MSVLIHQVMDQRCSKLVTVNVFNKHFILICHAIYIYIYIHYIPIYLYTNIDIYMCVCVCVIFMHHGSRISIVLYQVNIRYILHIIILYEQWSGVLQQRYYTVYIVCYILLLYRLTQQCTASIYILYTQFVYINVAKFYNVLEMYGQRSVNKIVSQLSWRVSSTEEYCNLLYSRENEKLLW